MRVRFFPPAKRDLVKAFDYLQHERPGLGFDFLDDVQQAVEQIKQFPRAAPEIDPGIRRQLCRRFRYGVLYRPLDGTIEILAVGHLKRHPNFWKRRLRIQDSG